MNHLEPLKCLKWNKWSSKVHVIDQCLLLAVWRRCTGELRIRSRQNDRVTDFRFIRHLGKERALRRGRDHLHQGCSRYCILGQNQARPRRSAEPQWRCVGQRQDHFLRRRNRSQWYVSVHQAGDWRRNLLRYRYRPRGRPTIAKIIGLGLR